MASEAKQAAYPKQSPIICQMTFSLFPPLFPLVLGIGFGGGSRPAGINSLKRYSFRFVFFNSNILSFTPLLPRLFAGRADCRLG